MKVIYNYMDMIAKEKVNLTTVIGVSEHEYQLNDGTTLVKSDDLPDLKVGDRVEISTDGHNVIWNFIIN
jgi:hypothetical protein